MELAPDLRSRANELIEARDSTLIKRFIIDQEHIPQNPSQLLFQTDLLNERQKSILKLDASSLADAISLRQYTSEEVVLTYGAAATIAHCGTNCLAWLSIDSALARAKELDKYLEESGTTVGPFHGVPISIKDFIQVKGFAQSAGHIASAGFIPSEDAHIVRILKDAGAVIMAKTTQPQSIMHLETSNFYGITTCAYNRLLTSGGSSGGEGALVGMHGSPMGVTTDIGGSTKNPAANNGLWGFKPTTKRFPRQGLTGVTSVSRIAGSIGPIAHSLRDIELFCKVILEDQPSKSDVTLVPIPWRDVDMNGKGAGFDGWSGKEGRLRIGVLRSDGVVRPVKPIRRALNSLVEKLEKDGNVELVEVEPRSSARIWEITSALYYIDGGEKLKHALGEEPMLPLTAWITKNARALSTSEVTELVLERNQLRQDYQTYFTSLNLDVILSPVGPAPAQLIGTTKYWNYTSFWNCLDWPAAVFPTGLTVTNNDEDDQIPLNEDESHLYSTYSAATSVDAPIGLQLSAPRWQDERLIAALKAIERVLPLRET